MVTDYRKQLIHPLSAAGPHVRFPSNAVTVLESDFWSIRYRFTALVSSWNSWRSGCTEVGREGNTEEWG